MRYSNHFYFDITIISFCIFLHSLVSIRLIVCFSDIDRVKIVCPHTISNLALKFCLTSYNQHSCDILLDCSSFGTILAIFKMKLKNGGRYHGNRAITSNFALFFKSRTA